VFSYQAIKLYIRICPINELAKVGVIVEIVDAGYGAKMVGIAKVIATAWSRSERELPSAEGGPIRL